MSAGRNNTGRGLTGGRVDAATALYIGVIALLARSSGLYYILFPELGALGHDILKRPGGRWASAPVMLVLTPLLTAFIGTLIARYLPYGIVPVLLDIGCSVLIIRLLRSPIAPAISAGLLPLTLDIRSLWYPPSLLIGTGLLAGIAAFRNRRGAAGPPAPPGTPEGADDLVEEPPTDWSWVPFFLVFVLLAYLMSDLTGWRLVLYPPLIVIGFEAFAHSAACPWAGRPIALPLACSLTATAGVLCVMLLGAGPGAAICSILVGVLVLRVLDLHVPPALAVGLLPFVMPQPGLQFPAAVLLGTAIETGVFLAWRQFAVARRAETD